MSGPMLAYPVTINGCETELQFTADEAAARGLSGGRKIDYTESNSSIYDEPPAEVVAEPVAEPVVAPAGDPSEQPVVVAGPDDTGAVEDGQKQADDPDNKARGAKNKGAGES